MMHVIQLLSSALGELCFATKDFPGYFHFILILGDFNFDTLRGDTTGKNIKPFKLNNTQSNVHLLQM